jgi:uncharacterized protein YecE (DUF72 family)
LRNVFHPLEFQTQFRDVLHTRHTLADVLERAEKTFVVANNHYKGQAAVNVLELKSMLGKDKPKAPKPLVEAYPDQLKGIADPV